MERRDFIKTIPAAAMLPIIGNELAENAGAVETAQAKATRQSAGGGAGGGQSKGFRVRDKTYKDAGAYDGVHCDQFGVDQDGKPIADNLTGTGSDAGPSGKDHKMTLTREEQDILNGSKGEVMAKVLKTIVMHGELFGAEGLGFLQICSV